MSGGSSRPLANGDSASASKRPSGTQSIAAWWAPASSSLLYHTPTMCLPERHAASLALPSPTTARHCAPTRSSAVMPMVQPSRAAWPTTWSSVWIDFGRRMRGIASISSRCSNSFMPKTNERSFNSRSRSPLTLVQSSLISSTFASMGLSPLCPEREADAISCLDPELVWSSFSCRLDCPFGRLGQKSRPGEAVALGVAINLGQNVFRQRDVDPHGFWRLAPNGHEDRNTIAVFRIGHDVFEAGRLRDSLAVLDKASDVQHQGFLRH